MQHSDYEIRKLCDPYDASALECDGLTRVLHTILSQKGIDHVCCHGMVFYQDGQCIPLHFWIIVNNKILDYRLKMWLEGDNIPNGLFIPSDSLHYLGGQVELEILSDKLMSIMLSEKYAKLKTERGAFLDKDGNIFIEN